MQTWLLDIFGGVLNGLAIILVGIWAAVFAWDKERGKEHPSGGKKPRPSRAKSRISTLLLTIVILLAVSSTAFQIVSAFQHHAADTQLVRYYDDQFNNMTQKRKMAALALREFMAKKRWSLVTNNIDGLDSVLSFFDSLGNEVSHGAISPETAHEYFQGDISPYYQASLEYIFETRTNEGESAATFEFIKPLFDDVQKVEAKKSGRNVADLKLSDAALKEYLDSEINSPNLKDGK
jgi:hypothetical protein